MVERATETNSAEFRTNAAIAAFDMMGYVSVEENML